MCHLGTAHFLVVEPCSSLDFDVVELATSNQSAISHRELSGAELYWYCSSAPECFLRLPVRAPRTKPSVSRVAHLLRCREVELAAIGARFDPAQADHHRLQARDRAVDTEAQPGMSAQARIDLAL